MTKYPNFEANLQPHIETLRRFELYHDKLEIKANRMDVSEFSECHFFRVQSSKQNWLFSTIAPTRKIQNMSQL